ncbi:MAG: peptidase [Gemmatimonadetes bacterium]|nr:peptidase [Gemmatimonadota bacterium]
MTHAAKREGVRHLEALAQHARPAGSVAERHARTYASRELAALGFRVREDPFTYSEFPGRYGTPVGGGILALAVALAAGLALRANTMLGMCVLVGGSVTTALFARWMFGSAQQAMPLLRASSVNLVATRGTEEPRVWLVAHLDSKSQPIPSAVRVAGVLTLLFALLGAYVAVALTLSGADVRTVWWGVLAAALAGGVPVAASVVGERSHGAVDNASGVASVLVAAARLRTDVACGVLLPSAEELGLAGVRAWVRGRAPAVALNCDGVDDDGDLVIMFNAAAPVRIVDAVRAAAAVNVRVRRMPLGLLTDSSALAKAGWSAVTVSHGSLATLRRIHTAADSLGNLKGRSIDDVGFILARAAEALAQ